MTCMLTNGVAKVRSTGAGAPPGSLGSSVRFTHGARAHGVGASEIFEYGG
jgi:hypothetical protein